MLNGYEPCDFGSHSCRKGVATWVAAGCNVSPPVISLCLRAGWYLGGVKNRYLFHENVGRCTSGLNADTAEFAVCRAHFDLAPGLLDCSSGPPKNRLWRGCILSLSMYLAYLNIYL